MSWSSRRLQLLGYALRPFARAAYHRFRAPVIAVTGSVGKTTTRDFIQQLLTTSPAIVRGHGPNDVTGVLTTLIGAHRVKTLPGFAGEFPRILARSLILPLPADYLVLEIAAGSIQKHLTVFTPKISVVTAIGPAHIERFGSLEAIASEKSNLISGLPEDGHAVLYYDDPFVRDMATLTGATTVSYGFSPQANIFMEHATVKDSGITATLHDPEGSESLVFPHLFNRSHLLAVMAAWSVGLIEQVPRDRMISAIQALSPLTGRGRLWTGSNESVLIDDAYNANPLSMKAALEAFHEVAAHRRRIAILGDMLELGRDSERYHCDIGRQAAAVADVLIAVGQRSELYVAEFTALRPDAPAYHTLEASEVLTILASEFGPGSAVLVKGSHGIDLQSLIDPIRILM